MIRKLLTPSMIVALIALGVGLAGGGVAATTLIGSGQIKDNSIQPRDLSPSVRNRIESAPTQGPQGPAGPRGPQGPYGADRRDGVPPGPPA